MAELADKRTLVFAGHGGAGKTSLVDALLHKAKVTSRLGRVDDGTSHLDTDDDEKDRKSSIRAAVASLTYEGKDITIIDTPGYPDFIGEVYSAMPAVESVCIVISAADGIGVNTRRCWDLAVQLGKPRMIVVTKIDNEHANFADTLSRIRQTFGDRCIPMSVPVGFGPGVESVVSVLGEEIPDSVKDQVETYKMEAVEAAVEADDAIMEKYLEAGSISEAEMAAVFPKAIAQGTFTPMFFASSTTEVGQLKMLDTIAKYFPSPADVLKGRAGKKGNEAIEVKPTDGFTAQVFKVQSAVVGKQALLRVWSGKIDSGTAVLNVRTGKNQKIGEFQRVVGKETTPLKSVSAGDIVMLSKVDDLTFGDTITSGDEIELERTEYPFPMVALAISPKSRNDETKLGEALHKLTDGDATFIAKFDADTKELVARGITELHLQTMLKLLKDRYKVEVETRPPRIPYRETITASVEAHHRHKKQTGGAGQFGEVYIRLKPLERAPASSSATTSWAVSSRTSSSRPSRRVSARRRTTASWRATPSWTSP